MAAPRVDRRLAAIMAVDVVGYSRLVGADEAGTLARVKAHRKELAEPVIAEHHGRVVKLTGDGALVEFASAVDAVECAVALQAGMAEREAAEPEERSIRYRIGINIGDIVLEDGDIFGDGVNVAARLEGLAEPGGICIARNVYNQVKGKLDLAFEPMGEHRVKNIAEPITVYRALPGPGTRAKTRPMPIARALRQHRPAVIAAAMLLLLLAGAAAGWYALWQPSATPPAAASQIAGGPAAEAKPALPLPDKPSIAVLPFDDLSGEDKYERLAGGLTEDVITDLSRFRDLFVIARNSTEVYKGKPVDVRQVARELGVQYVLEGSLQSDGEQVRITAQLVDAITGNHVWSERYDRPLEHIFAVQDEVTKTIVGSVAGHHGIVARAGKETSRRKPPESLQVYDYYLLGMEAKHRFTKEDNKKAQEFFQKAIERDPDFARAYVGLAYTYNLEIDMQFGDSWEQSMDDLLKAAQKAVALDPYDAEARFLHGLYFQYLNDYERAVSGLDQALELNPNHADVLAHSIFLLKKAGQPERALDLVERAVRLNPHHPDWYYGALREAYFYNRRFEDAIAATKKRLIPSPLEDPQVRAMSYAQLGREREAAQESRALLEAYPDYSAEKFLSGTGTYARETERDLFLDSIEKAGLPVCATEEQLAKYPDMERLPECEAQRASG
jgi:TolB-like protein/class 3 adenylate cyclase/tetratricopeptide (TPR) repeat protein